MSQQEKERELKNLMILEKHIEEDIRHTKLRLDALHYAADRCALLRWELKEELRIR